MDHIWNQDVSVGCGQNTHEECEVVRKYADELVRAMAIVKGVRPDFVVALSRKAPRLLEILQKCGMFTLKVPVITEKAIDFVQLSELSQKRVLVFDDIIISGSSVQGTLTDLSNRFDSDLHLAVVAIDDETIALNNYNEDSYTIETGTRGSVPLHYAVPFRSADRYDFCSSIVRSFATLNKSYDIDFPILYSGIRSPSNSWRMSPVDQYFDMTTVSQFDQGYTRSTIMDPNGTLASAFATSVFKQSELHPGVCKVRVYQNAADHSTVLVPIVTLHTRCDALASCECFCDDLSSLNQLLSAVSKRLPSTTRAQALYRLVTFIASYIYGCAFLLRNAKAFDTGNGREPSFYHSAHDLRYLFGIDSCDVILEHLAGSQSQIMTFAAQHLDYHAIGRMADQDHQPVSVSADVFDSQREQLFKTIVGSVGNRLSRLDPVSTQVATIFEAMYCVVELPAQKQARKEGLKGGEDSRLKVGFNYEQLRDMTQRLGIFETLDRNSDTLLSLAIDHLVDDGVQIPMFYYGEDGALERVYRYGEEALNELRFSYAVARTFEALFGELHKTYGHEYLRRLTSEKMGVVFIEELRRRKLLSALMWQCGDPTSQKMLVSPGYQRHGRVLNISYSSHQDSEQFPMLFNQWCVRKKILEEPRVGIKYDQRFLKELRQVDGTEPMLETDDVLAVLSNIALLLYEIDEKLDPSSGTEYLIALTACADTESYLWALREELAIVFERHQSDLQTSLSMIKKCLNELSTYPADKLSRLSSRLKKAKSAAHEVSHKKRLRQGFHEYCQAIDTHFASGGALLWSAYRLTLAPYIRGLKHKRNMQLPGPVRDERQRLECLGCLSICMTSLLVTYVELIRAVRSVELTKAGEPDQRRVTAVVNRRESLAQGVEKWNDEVERQLSHGLTDTRLEDLMLFEVSMYSPTRTDDCSEDEIEHLVNLLYPTLEDNCQILGEWYQTRYSLLHWNTLVADNVRLLYTEDVREPMASVSGQVLEDPPIEIKTVDTAKERDTEGSAPALPATPETTSQVQKDYIVFENSAEPTPITKTQLETIQKDRYDRAFNIYVDDVLGEVFFEGIRDEEKVPERSVRTGETYTYYTLILLHLRIGSSWKYRELVPTLLNLLMIGDSAFNEYNEPRDVLCRNINSCISRIKSRLSKKLDEGSVDRFINSESRHTVHIRSFKETGLKTLMVMHRSKYDRLLEAIEYGKSQSRAHS